jgi:hypothetical protein
MGKADQDQRRKPYQPTFRSLPRSPSKLNSLERDEAGDQGGDVIVIIVAYPELATCQHAY